jgi:hypothetical protein
MAHYAFIDSNNIVTQVIVGRNELDQGVDWEQWYGYTSGQICKRTSYNTHGGKHFFGKTPFRKNYAGIGFTYDSARDAFIPPQPFPSWVLNEETCLWDAPVAIPTDGQRYYWDEATTNWVVTEL